jgi:hypothetical protein
MLCPYILASAIPSSLFLHASFTFKIGISQEKIRAYNYLTLVTRFFKELDSESRLLPSR